LKDFLKKKIIFKNKNLKIEENKNLIDEKLIYNFDKYVKLTNEVEPQINKNIKKFKKEEKEKEEKKIEEKKKREEEGEYDYYDDDEDYMDKLMV
jgi:hypothetical protein